MSSPRWRQDVWRPLAVREVTLLVGVAAAYLWAHVSGTDRFRRWFALWDADWYGRIAEHGYPHEVVIDPTGRLLVGGEFAFFPVFPMLGRLVGMLPLIGPRPALLSVAILASLALGPLVYAVARGEGLADRPSLMAVRLLAAVPMPVILFCAYAEALFLDFGLLALLGAQRRRWGWVALALVAASLTRPAGVVTAAGLFAYAVLHWWRRRGGGGELAVIVGACSVGVAGVPAFWWWAGQRAGRGDAWFAVQEAGWATRFDGGASTWEFLDRLFVVHDLPLAVAVPTFATLATGVAITMATLVQRDTRPYAGWLLAGLASVVAASNFWYSKPRLLLVMAVAVVPLAMLAGPRWASIRGWFVVGLLAAAQLTFGLYMALTWPYAI